MAAPAIAGLVRDLVAERRERIRSEERARVAAHLHDSVLQTLALIQRSGGDPAQAAALARRQERELRAWLYGADPDRRAGTVRAVLEDVCAAVEQLHGVPVELVVVGGGATAGPRVIEAMGAVREAVVNAARHADTDRIDVYAETGADGLTVYVRDTGRGFEPEAVPPDPGWPTRVRGRTDGAPRRHVGGDVFSRRRDRGRAPPAGGHVMRRVVVVDDHELVRAGVRTELAGRVAVIGEATDVLEAIEVIARERPDVVLLDVHLPGGGGAAVIAGILEQGVETVFLALSVSDAAEDVVGVIRAGARGYVTKAISGDDLVLAIERVAAGDPVFSPRLAGFVLDAFAGEPPTTIDPELDRLTAREREVMRLLARGYAYKEIARRLSISIKTVETHASSVLRKLQLSSRNELASWAARRRLL